MSEWREYRLGELGFFFGGVTSIKKEDYGFGTPFLQYMNVYKNWKVDITDLELMNVKVADIKKRNCIFGDVFFTASSETEDEVAMSSVLLDNIENLTYNGFCKRYRLFNLDTLMPRFARYLFRNRVFRGEVYQRVTGDVRFNISQESLSEIPINIPPLPEQKAIAEVLSSLDDKIDLLHRQNKTLEQMAETLFRQWFVEQSKEDWVYDELKNYVDIVDNRGKTPPNNDIKTEFPLIEANALNGNGRLVDYLLIKKFVSEETFNNWFRNYLKKYDTLITTVGANIGAMSMFILEKGNIAQNIIGISGKTISPFFLFQVLKYKRNEVLQMDIGGVQPSIKVPHLLSLDIPIPPFELQKMFDIQVLDFVSKMENNYIQIRTLEKMRDTLLPKLMSGEIRIVETHGRASQRGSVSTR